MNPVAERRAGAYSLECSGANPSRRRVGGLIPDLRVVATFDGGNRRVDCARVSRSLGYQPETRSQSRERRPALCRKGGIMGASSRTLLAKLGFADADRKSPRHDLACNYIGLQPQVLSRVLGAALPSGLVVLEPSGTLEFQVLKGEGKYSTTVGFVDVFATFTIGHRFRMRKPTPEPYYMSESLEVRRRIKVARAAHPVFGRPDWEAKHSGDEFLSLLDWEREAGRALSAELGATEDLLEPRYRDAKAAAPPCASDSIAALASFTAVIEVKITPCGVGDLIRQLRVYNEHVPPSRPSRKSLHPSSEWEEIVRRKCNREFEEFEGRANHYISLVEKLPRITIAALDFEIDTEYRSALRASGITPVRLGAGFEEFLRTRHEAPPTDGGGEVPSI